MNVECPVSETSERREPIWLTVADLSMLVIGVALAIYLREMHFPSDRIKIGNISMPGWVPWLFVIEEVAMKTGLALAFVIMARRARYGGLPKPGDWLAIAVGLTLLLEAMKRTQWQKSLARWVLVDLRQSLGWDRRFPSELPRRGAIGSEAQLRWVSGGLQAR